jgi:hypothetical protein
MLTNKLILLHTSSTVYVRIYFPRHIFLVVLVYISITSIRSSVLDEGRLQYRRFVCVWFVLRQILICNIIDVLIDVVIYSCQYSTYCKSNAISAAMQSVYIYAAFSNWSNCFMHGVLGRHRWEKHPYRKPPKGVHNPYRLPSYRANRKSFFPIGIPCRKFFL